MTEAQKLRTEGFRASLGVRGVKVRIGNLPWVSALMDTLPPQSGQYVPGEADRASGILAVLREDLTSAGYTGPTIGQSFEQEGGVIHRIAEVRDVPVDIAVRFPVETSQPT
jgi:hypothetical protein